MLEAKARIEIKSLGLRIGPNSTQDQLETAIKHRPDLLENGLIIRTSKKQDNGKASKKDNDKKEGNNGNT